MHPPDPGALLRGLAAASHRQGRLTHIEVLPSRTAVQDDWPDWLAPGLVEAWQGLGIDRPWRHQVEAADLVHRGVHTVLATGTASGKSLGYLMPALSAILGSRRGNGARGSTVLYISPTKALAQDQLVAVRQLRGANVRAITHDGDSTADERDFARDHAEYVLTNPDMLHHSLLPGHERWHGFWRRLDHVIIDECHYYRGVFGAHVAQIVRRLRRVAAAHGAQPTFVLASATAAEPALTAGRLVGLPVEAVTEDTSPRGRVTLGLWEPPFVSHAGENAAPVRRSAGAEVADLLADLVVAGVRTLAFVRSRRGVEVVSVQARHLLAEIAPELSDRVAAYRGGYLPEERRALERALRDGRLLGLAATNALELGIDISGLDAVLLSGFPGTRAAFWQQVGRAGRGATDALGMLIARDDPLDTYLVHHPEALIGVPVEAAVFDPDNAYVLGPHLCAAASEIPLTDADEKVFGPAMPAAVAALTEGGLLRQRRNGWYWTDRRRASDLADLRSTGGPPIRLVEAATGRMLGTADSAAAHSTAHPGAVYLHQGESYLVRELDLDEGVAFVEATRVDYSTSAREITDITILSETTAARWGEARLVFGRVRVTHQVVAFLRRRQPGGEVLGEEPLDLPERVLETTAVWWTLPSGALAAAGLEYADLPGAAHAAEHAAIGLLPLFATCDRWDIGGVSTAHHPDTGMVTVFVYDGHPGGAGFAERGFRAATEWLRATREAIDSCACVDGCPSCVQSPKCGNQNNPLDKPGSIALLDVLLQGAPRTESS